jgi:hypothetical protein
MGPYDLLHKIVEAFERLKIEYLVTGSIASMAYGEPRFTNDIDIVATIHESHIDRLLKVFLQGEFYISDAMIRQAIRHHDFFHRSKTFSVDGTMPCQHTERKKPCV